MPLRIAFLGDSISEVGRSPKWHGGASQPSANWGPVAIEALRSETATPLLFRHFGIGGQNTYEGLGRLDALEDFQPELVVVAFGANDCCHHFLVPDETRFALCCIVEQVRERFGASSVIVGTGGDNPHRPFFRHLEETLESQQQAARESGVPFVDIRTAILNATDGGRQWGKYHLADDNCHPNDHGHRVWAETLVPHVKSWIQRKHPAIS